MTPVLTRVWQRAKRKIKPTKFDGSANYWENRYKTGGNSGAGSYNQLAHFKAEVLNRFVAENGIHSVIEFGSGDGAQLELADYPSYIGVDVSLTAIEATRYRFAGDPTKRFALPQDAAGETAELALSLDVIYHLVEDDVFDTYMRQLFASATRYVIVYASNEEKAWPDPHVRHRQFTRWVDENQPAFSLVKIVPNRYPYSTNDPDNTSFADFFIFASP